MFSSISSLISGNTGINSAQIVADLVQITREPRESAINQKQQLNSARISALASASSSLNTFADALQGILDGRRFSGDLVSSDGNVAVASFIEGQTPKGLPVTMEVKQLAAEQKLISRNFTDAAQPVGEGTLTLSTSAGNFDIVIDNTNDSLTGLRDALNAANAGVTASIVTDNRGTRLVIAGQDGADQGFTLTPPPDPLVGQPSAINDFAYPPGNNGGMTAISQALDSIVVIDGVELVNSSNEISDAIEGVKLSLLKATPGETITISANEPPTTTRELVTEFIDAFNSLKQGLNTATAPGLEGADGGPLAGNRAIRDMVSKLARMSSEPLANSGPFRTLADIGVRTARDGTLELDSVAYDRAIALDPDAVASMLDPLEPDANNPGIAGTLDKIRDTLEDKDGPLALAKQRFEDINTKLAEMRVELDEDIDKYQANLQQTYANMDRQLAVLKQTQEYLKQQISIWNSSSDN
jgi:flagellar hook-associated protein 2